MLATVLAVTALAPATFAAGPGWHVGAGRVQACPGEPAVRCESVSTWASTVPWRDCAGCLPHRTLARLPSDGIALQLLLSREPKTPKWMRPISWPPRIPAACPGLEGLPKRIGVVQVLGTRRGLHAYLFVFFGRTHPTAAQRARARRELATARFP
jgi:hypothetical protein